MRPNPPPPVFSVKVPVESAGFLDALCKPWTVPLADAMDALRPWLGDLPASAQFEGHVSASWEYNEGEPMVTVRLRPAPPP